MNIHTNTRDMMTNHVIVNSTTFCCGCLAWLLLTGRVSKYLQAEASLASSLTHLKDAVFWYPRARLC